MEDAQTAYFLERYPRMTDEELSCPLATRGDSLSEEASHALRIALSGRDPSGIRNELQATAADVGVQTQRAMCGNLFHTDLSSMGAKIDANEFLPITRSINQHAVRLSSVAQGQLIGQLEGARSIKLRLRFWPYNTLRDSDALSTDGMKQRLAVAQACAARL